MPRARQRQRSRFHLETHSDTERPPRIAHRRTISKQDLEPQQIVNQLIQPYLAPTPSIAQKVHEHPSSERTRQYHSPSQASFDQELTGRTDEAPNHPRAHARPDPSRASTNKRKRRNPEEALLARDDSLVVPKVIPSVEPNGGHRSGSHKRTDVLRQHTIKPTCECRIAVAAACDEVSMCILR